MKQTRVLMGMPVVVEIINPISESVFDEVYDYFKYIDEKFSTYKETSEISRINKGELTVAESSDDMKLVFELSEKTKQETDGYFDIKTIGGTRGAYDPSGLVKGWAIWKAASILDKKNIKNFYIDAGGDIETRGVNAEGKAWIIGIQDPTNKNANVLDKEKRGIIKVVTIADRGIATSGTYVRGQHIYDPKKGTKSITDIVSITVIGPNIYEADRFATAAFAMGKEGIVFIESLRERYGLEAYMVDAKGIATMTSGFDEYVVR